MVMMADRNPQPRLIKSVSEEDDDDDDDVVVSEPVAEKEEEEEPIDYSALAYLLRYETMVRQQEAENMACLAHVRPLLQRVEALGGVDTAEDEELDDKDTNDIMQRQVSFLVLAKALQQLEERDEFDSSSAGEPMMQSDRQFMLVLRTLTEQRRRQPQPQDDDEDDETISWAEIYQCYKSVIAGMQTLQLLPPSSQARARARDRSLSILSLFQPAATKLLTDDTPHRTIERTDDDVLDKSRAGGALTTTKKKQSQAWRVLALVGMMFAIVIGILASATDLLDGYMTTSEPVNHQDAAAPVNDSTGSVWVAQEGMPANVTLTKLAVVEVVEKHQEPATKSAPAAAGVVAAAAPVLLKCFLMMPSPLQSLSVLTFGGLSFVSAIADAWRFLMQRRICIHDGIKCEE